VTYTDAIQFLYQLRLFGLKLGLETTRLLAERLGHPDRKLRFIHVAGTNGKGSTCAILESIYRQADLRVGLFTSPHLVRFGERIQVNRQFIPEPDIARLVGDLRHLLTKLPPDRHPTFFEVVTVLALQFFAEQQCDLVIWETGMGGRLDATNIVTPLASVITNVQLDHQKWLGSTHALIAAEKAGIIKAGVPVLTATDEPTALQVLSNTARSLHAPLTRVTRQDVLDRADTLQHLALLGEHQKFNASLALATVQTLQHLIPVSPPQIRSGLQQVHWPGRLQLLRLPNHRLLLLDGAHNVAGAEALRTALWDRFPGQSPTLILGTLEDKEWAPMALRLAPLAGRILCVPVRSERSAPPTELARACREANPAVRVEEHPSLGAALESCGTDALVVVAGSLYLVGETLQWLGLSAYQDCREIALNDYSTRP
jgi:dihydrofolate synthase / folylpolyglutamate synthase